MLRNPILSLSILSCLAAGLTAQCRDNEYPVTLVSAAGVPAPLFNDPAGFGVVTAQFTTESVYLAFDPTTPSGIYYVHVIDPPNGSDAVQSRNDPMDRFVQVQNNAGVITLSLPYTNNQTPAVFGIGLNGQGQSILLQPFASKPDEPCRWKVCVGDSWDLSAGPENPFLIQGGFNSAFGRCAVFSYMPFRIGSGNGSEVSGLVFDDADRDGVLDSGELGLPNCDVRLVTSATSVTTTTDASGRYAFPDVAAGNYTVELPAKPGFVVTTAGQFTVEVCGCANVEVGNFGVAPGMLACDGHTIGFWRNRHGIAIVQSHNILATLPALFLRNLCGHHVAPGNICAFRFYLQCATSWNMAYMLSAQLLAMHCNILAGFVDPDCMIRDCRLGNITIAELVQRSITSLMAHGFTPPCSQWRREQEILKNALDAANNNRNWL